MNDDDDDDDDECESGYDQLDQHVRILYHSYIHTYIHVYTVSIIEQHDNII
jgi:hypothetical protein